VILAIDVGNSYIKYKTWVGDDSHSGRVPNSAIDDFLILFKESAIKKVIFASVAVTDIEHKVRCSFAHAEFVLVQTKKECLGVINAYDEFSKLGVDRWLAMIGAYHHSGKKPCMVFDLGTAITLDVIDKKGVHRGGYITPGLEMMRESLRQSTQKVRYEVRSNVGIDYGCNTRDAVENGTFRVILAWINEEVNIFNKSFPGGVVYFTGGLVREIRPYIYIEAVYYDELVLDALKRVSVT
jgi:type III pantothenate kinase